MILTNKTNAITARNVLTFNKREQNGEKNADQYKLVSHRARLTLVFVVVFIGFVRCGCVL